MKVYEKLGIDPATEEGMLRLLSFRCEDLPLEIRMCGDCDSCSQCKFKYLFSEVEEREIDWTKVPKDTPVLVCDKNNSVKIHRHFAEFKDGKCWVYQWGLSSWTNDMDITCWKYCELAFPEQAKEEWYK